MIIIRENLENLYQEVVGLAFDEYSDKEKQDKLDLIRKELEDLDSWLDWIE